MRIDDRLTDLKFINLYSIKDPSMHLSNYLYAERLGKDSVAFICVDKDDHDNVLLNKEFKPPVDEFVWGAFGGSIDKKKSHEEIVIDEVKEEAGYVVTKDDVKEVGKCLVSTQMNQYCYLFLVFVDRSAVQEREPENEIEAMAETKWAKQDDIADLNEWKPITILSKAKNIGLV